MGIGSVVLTGPYRLVWDVGTRSVVLRSAWVSGPYRSFRWVWDVRTGQCYRLLSLGQWSLQILQVGLGREDWAVLQVSLGQWSLQVLQVGLGREDWAVLQVSLGQWSLQILQVGLGRED